MGIFDRFKQTKMQQTTVVASGPEPSKITAPDEFARTLVVSDVILRPLVTEKAAVMTGTNTYVFVVKNDANRVAVRMAIKKMYGVDPVRVNIQNVEGKKKRFGHNIGKRSDWKKALVTLPAGKTINVHEGV
jgi:large subunit ribosomal protein L23